MVPIVVPLFPAANRVLSRSGGRARKALIRIPFLPATGGQESPLAPIPMPLHGDAIAP